MDSATQVDDDELAAQAMAADPDTVVDDDAVCLWDLVAPGGPSPLPAWYMPAPSGGRLLRGWRRRLVLVIIAAFVVINMHGLCSTYGWVELA